MSDAYCIWVVTPPGYRHSGAFHEVALGLQGGFRELGINAPIVTSRERLSGRVVVLGANLLPGMPGVKLPGKSIIYNLEQITPGSEWLSTAYLKLLRRHCVWDYSRYNMEQLVQLGVDRLVHCPLGYSERLTRITHANEKDIDVLFYGSMNERRQQVLRQLDGSGLRTEALFGVYGEERDSWIARSRIVLNIHYYPAKIFEIVRISYLLANRVCVVSEESPPDSALESVQDGIVQAPLDQLAASCHALIADNAWECMAQRGFAAFAGSRQSEHLRAALYASSK
ncbi:MAG: hypothetical protein R3F42_11345 [Pseudomonadota bacterium]